MRLNLIMINPLQTPHYYHPYIYISVSGEAKLRGECDCGTAEVS